MQFVGFAIGMAFNVGGFVVMSKGRPVLGGLIMFAPYIVLGILSATGVA